ncbi:amino acid ABC transporter permease [Fusibacter sp. JL216-2]|uniref:amino acid ABC transporter permease n=1 Tax=Fusibacter sp. JL216-2 TaxID=3071453 RepID=UPI003D32C445
MNGFDLNYFINIIPVILKALPVTLAVGISAMLFGFILGVSISLIRKMNNPVLNPIIEVYVSFFRGTPLMVQLFIFFFGLPQIIPALAKLSAFQAAIIVMTINASAYISEVIRSAIDSVDKGQMEAALSVGMSRSKAMERIVLPQAFKVAVPPLGNTFISLLQGTAITFMLGLQDIMGLSKMKAAASYRFLESFLAVGLIYWALTLIATQVNKKLEWNLSKGGAL